ncbi:MAG: hypothetical protein WBM69_28255 [Desulfobacterales bacterium]
MLNLPVERLDKKNHGRKLEADGRELDGKKQRIYAATRNLFIVNWKITDLILYAAANAFSKMLLYLGLIHLDDFVQFFGKLSDMVAAFPG